MGKYEWLDLILRMRVPPQRKAVAQAMAWFARPDGSSVRPGQKKVADMAGVHVSKAGPHVRALRDAGLLDLVKAGGGRGGDPDHYRLSRPADVSALPLWLDPDMDRYPAGGPTEEIHQPSAVGVAGTATTEQEPSEVGETGEQQPPTVDVPPVDNSEHRPPAVGETGRTQTADGPNSPVDNQKHRPFRSETTTVSSGNNDRPRSTNTLRTPSEHLLGLPQATNSLGALGQLVEKAEAEISDEDYNAARIRLGRFTDFGLAYQVRAERELEAAGHRGPSMRLVIVRAAHIADQSPNGA
jgi:hypothetical protein